MEPFKIESEESIEERYNKMLNELIAQGWSPRKARKYLEAISRKQIEKIFKKKANKGVRKFNKKFQHNKINQE